LLLGKLGKSLRELDFANALVRGTTDESLGVFLLLSFVQLARGIYVPEHPSPTTLNSRPYETFHHRYHSMAVLVSLDFSGMRIIISQPVKLFYFPL
jgi:hypothetical protein